VTRAVGIGAGGHAKAIIDTIQEMGGVEIVGLTDTRPDLRGSVVLGVPVLGGDELLTSLRAQGVGLAFIGIGGIRTNEPRARLYERALELGFAILNAIHPRASVARSASVGDGVAILAGSVVGASASLGRNVIINSGAVVEHDCVIGDHVHVGPGAAISGGVRLGQLVHIGTGASIRQSVTIGERAVVGAGAVVINDVPAGAVVVGVPARPMREGGNG
jgi:UDP-perosamine 4-acetyltransferase